MIQEIKFTFPYLGKKLKIVCSGRNEYSSENSVGYIYVADESREDYIELVNDSPESGFKSDNVMLSKACKIASIKLGKKLSVGYTDDGVGELELYKKQNNKIVPGGETMYHHCLYVTRIIARKINKKFDRPLFISEDNKIKKEYKAWYKKYNTKKDKKFINLMYKDIINNSKNKTIKEEVNYFDY